MPVMMSDERPVRARPFRRHAVARQVARHEVQQPGHRRRAGKPEDRDRADVVERAEAARRSARARDTPARGRRPDARAGTRRRESARAVTKLLPCSITLMISAAVRSSFFVLRMRPSGLSSVSVGVAPHERHHRHAGLEPRQAERELGKQDDRHRAPSSAGCRAARTATPSSRRRAPDGAQISPQAVDDDDAR